MEIVLNKTSFLDVPIQVEPMHGVTFSNENKGHKFVVSCMRGGELLTLTGTVTARFMRANNTTILIAGNDYTGIVDGKAVVTLPQDCYNVPGRFQMAIFLTADGATSCIYACVGSVQRTQNGDLIDSGEAVPSLEELLAQIDACEQATADATAAANAVPGLVAETFATNKKYTVGSYVYYNGSLYRFTADHAAGVWAGSDATAVKLANDVSDLESAIAQNEVGLIALESGTYNDNDGTTKTTGNQRMRNKYPVAVRSISEIKMPSGYNIWWFALDENMDMISHTSGWANSLTIGSLPTDTAYINFGIRNQSTPSADISGQIETVQSGIVLTYIAETALSIAETVKKAYDNYINLFNPDTVHDGIHSQTNGAAYGTITASADYCYTELLPLNGLDKLYVFNDFMGRSTIYVTYFSAARTVIGKVNGYNPVITNFPETAVYFCVTVAKTYLQTCMIYPEYHAEYIPYGIRIDSIYGYAKYNHKRLDRVFFVDYQANSNNAGNSPFPYKATSGVYISALMAIPDNGVSYRKAESFTPRVFYTTSANTIISYEDCSSTAGALTIPDTAEYMYYLAGTNSGARDPETAFCLVAGTTPPDVIYSFDDIEINGLNVNSEDYLSGKSIVFDGDSITEGAGVTDITTGIAPNNNKGWGYWIQQNHPDSNCYGYGKSGWTVGKVEGETDSLLNHIPQYPQDVDLFVLSGGYNDQAQQMAMGELVEVTDGANAYYNATFDQYTFCGALEYWFQQLRITYPTAQIVYVLTPKRIYTTNPVFNNDTKGVRVKDVLYSTGYERMNKFWAAIKAACDKWAVRYIDLSDVSGVVGTGETTDTGLTVNSRYFQITDGVPDMTHPNTLYYKTFIVPQIEALIKSVID